jgi:hypothetical protein
MTALHINTPLPCFCPPADHNPQADIQAQARAHRLGQQNGVMVRPGWLAAGALSHASASCVRLKAPSWPASPPALAGMLCGVA